VSAFVGASLEICHRLEAVLACASITSYIRAATERALGQKIEGERWIASADHDNSTAVWQDGPTALSILFEFLLQ